MPKRNLTDAFIKSVVVTKDTEFTDELSPRLHLRVSPAGGKKFEFRYKSKNLGRRVRYPIGEYGVISLSEARKQAHIITSQLMMGEDPQYNRLASKSNEPEFIESFSELVELYIERGMVKLAPVTKDDYLSYINKYILPKFRNMNVSDIRRRDIQYLLDEIVSNDSKYRTANLVRAVISVIFNFGIDHEYIDRENPVTRIKRFKRGIVKRERFYSKSEIVKIWDFLNNEVLDPERTFYKMLLLLGQRKSETASMMKKDVNFENQTWVIPSHKTKNRRQHTMYLPNYVCELLKSIGDKHPKSDYFFKSRVKKRKNLDVDHIISPEGVAKRVKEKIGGSLLDFRIHDIRRTFSTTLSKEHRISDKIIGLTINHATQAGLNQITAVYIRNDHEKERREAIQLWEDWLLKLVGEKN